MIIVKRPNSFSRFRKPLFESSDHTINPIKPVTGPCQYGITGSPVCSRNNLGTLVSIFYPIIHKIALE